SERRGRAGRWHCREQRAAHRAPRSRQPACRHPGQCLRAERQRHRGDDRHDLGLACLPKRRRGDEHRQGPDARHPQARRITPLLFLLRTPMPPVLPIAILPHAHAATNGSSSGSNAGTSGSGTTTGSPSSGADQLPANMQISQAGFLQLISTQMRNQDPLNPTDPTQFLAQIEGLSQVSSLQSIQQSMSGLASGLQGAQLLSGTSLLGHSVLAAGNTATLAAGGSVSGAVSAPTGSNALAVSVTDASGALVNAFTVAPAASGYTPFTWDGTTGQGG